MPFHEDQMHPGGMGEDMGPQFEPEPMEAGSGDSPLTPETAGRNDLIANILKQVHESLGLVIELLDGGSGDASKQMADLVTSKKHLSKQLDDVSGSRVLEGVFDGMAMVGSDGKSYSVPPNYSSKSRLVEGDVMKLTIRADGSFVFKQIGPIERKRVVGTLAFDASTNSYVALSEGKTLKVLTASVTYFKGEPGDECVLLVPNTGTPVWAAVENIIKK